MNKQRLLVLFFSVVSFFLAPSLATSAEVDRFPSGLIRSFTANTPTERLQSGGTESREELDAVFTDFLIKNFEQGKGGIEWQLVDDTRDNTHRHRLFRLMFGGRPVLNQFVKLHYSNLGFMEFATSSWSARFLSQPFYSDRPKVIAAFQKQIAQKYGSAIPKLKTEIAFAVELGSNGKENTLKPVLVMQAGAKHPAAATRWIVDEVTGKTIDERLGMRFHQHEEEPKQTDARSVENYAGSSNCYTVSPPATGTVPVDNGDHYDLTSPVSPNGNMVGPYLEVRRGHGAGAAPLDVKVISNYPGMAGWDANDPDSYNGACAGLLTTDCPNQAFEAQNVHVHLSTFRNKMINYLNIDLGLSTCGGGTCFPADPLKVIVNAPPINAGSSTISSNNAAFIPNCSIFNYTSCLVFFKPAAINGTSCGGTAVTKLYSVAREANVVVHEFQHYITDSITHIAFASSATLNVGDALHEGYSDYFAASHVVANSGGNMAGAKILGYSFKNCPTIIRDVAVLRPYQIVTSSAAHYDVGLTWASGLYQLRSEFDTVKHADLLALKSQTFITPSPGYIEAVESLVKADLALYQGVHVSRIRALFYNELKFINGQSSPFRNTESLVAEVGFRSCSGLATSFAGQATNPWPSFGAFGLWLASLISAGRAWRKRRKGNLDRSQL